jgi:hypothetical protein
MKHLAEQFEFEFPAVALTLVPVQKIEVEERGDTEFQPEINVAKESHD